MNLLFVMYDQLRWDYLSCAGRAPLETPHFDRLASMGARFDRAYVQSPVCGPSRMSFYTGRYVSSHGASYNNAPLKVGEITLGDHLRALGRDCALIGKTHMQADVEGMRRLGISANGVIGARLAECGFDPRPRDDGLWAVGPDGRYDPRPSPYEAYLRERGYSGANPWHDHANAAIAEDGTIASGFAMRHARKPANIAEKDSETAWLTDRALEFLDAEPGPWLLHLSYIKPHWPYIAPAPYHALYSAADIPAPMRAESERRAPNPIFRAFMESEVARCFSRDETREAAIPAYMGLVKQCDDHFGRILDRLEETGAIDDTMIVLTSDHGDYLGDHWLGEKDLFHDASARVPMIVYDPRPSADPTRGTVSDALVEAIDLAPTFVEAAGGAPPRHILEGRSLLPLLRGERPADWRRFAVSEYDLSFGPIGEKLGLSPEQSRLFMIFDGRFKMIRADGPLAPMLFDLDDDPEELRDLGRDGAFADEIARLDEALCRWARRRSQRTTVSDEEARARRGASMRKGVLLGLWDERTIEPSLTRAYRGPAPGSDAKDPSK